MNKKDDITVINMGYVLSILKRNIISILVWAILGVVFSLITVFMLVEPKYSSSIDILVNQKK